LRGLKKLDNKATNLIVVGYSHLDELEEYSDKGANENIYYNYISKKNNISI
jgi:hypothetical protein